MMQNSIRLLKIYSLNKLNVAQNNIIRYMTGRSSQSRISQTTSILKIFNIHQLFVYMKL